jgi:hypothetical protein
MRKVSFAAALCLFTAIPVGARAQEAAPAPVAAAAPEAPAVTPHLIGGNTGILVGGVSDKPYALGAIALDPGLILGLGVVFGMDGGLPTGSQVTFGGILHASYYIKNSANFAVGPELFLIMPFAPTAAATLNVQPGVALWYAPFSAPILFGTALQLDIKYTRDSKTAALNLLTPGLRIAYAF